MTAVLVHRLQQDFVLPVTVIVGCGDIYGPGCYQGKPKLCYTKLSPVQCGNIPLQSETDLLCTPTQAVCLTLSQATRAALQLRNSLSRRLCHELAITGPVVTCPTSVTCVAHLPVTERPAAPTCGIKGEAFRAHSSLCERCEPSQGVSSCIEGGSLCVTAAIHHPAMHPAGKDYQLQARLYSRQQHIVHMRCSSCTHAVSPLY